MKWTSACVMLLGMLSGLVGCDKGPPDYSNCIDLTRGAGLCTKTFSGKQKVIKADRWAQFVRDSVKIPLDDAEKLIVFFDNFCRKNTCNISEAYVKKLGHVSNVVTESAGKTKQERLQNLRKALSFKHNPFLDGE